MSETKDYYLYTLTFWKHTSEGNAYCATTKDELNVDRKTGFRKYRFSYRFGPKKTFIEGKIGWKISEDDELYEVSLISSLPNHERSFRRIAGNKLTLYLIRKCGDYKGEFKDEEEEEK